MWEDQVPNLRTRGFYSSAANANALNSAVDADWKLFTVEHTRAGVVMAIGDPKNENAAGVWSSDHETITDNGSGNSSSAPGLLGNTGQPLVLANTVAATLQCVNIEDVTGISNFSQEAVSGNFTKDVSDEGDSILIQPSGYQWTNTGAAN